MTFRPSLPGVPMSPRSTSAQPAQQPWLSKLHAPCKCASGNAWRNASHVCGCDGKGSMSLRGSERASEYLPNHSLPRLDNEPSVDEQAQARGGGRSFTVGGLRSSLHALHTSIPCLRASSMRELLRGQPSESRSPTRALARSCSVAPSQRRVARADSIMRVISVSLDTRSSRRTTLRSQQFVSRVDPVGARRAGVSLTGPSSGPGSHGGRVQRLLVHADDIVPGPILHEPADSSAMSCEEASYESEWGRLPIGRCARAFCPIREMTVYVTRGDGRRVVDQIVCECLNLWRTARPWTISNKDGIFDSAARLYWARWRREAELANGEEGPDACRTEIERGCRCKCWFKSDDFDFAWKFRSLEFCDPFGPGTNGVYTWDVPGIFDPPDF